MQMNGYTDRTINAGNIVYDTTPEEVAFGYSGFGSYQVIGFMADKFKSVVSVQVFVPAFQVPNDVQSPPVALSLMNLVLGLGWMKIRCGLDKSCE